MALPAQSERPQGEINTLLGRGSEFEGKLTFEGTVRIDGKLSGEIFSEDVLVVGEGAMVNAEIDVGVIIVEGNVTGNIRAKRAVELHAPARVKGNIETPSLYIDKGVVFEGFSKMEGIGAGPPHERPRTLEGLAAAAAKGGTPPTGTGAAPTAPAPAPPPTKK
jgi:cytoskeletal protein CcmA (bactofilin family)